MSLGRFLHTAFLGLALLHAAGLQARWAAAAWTGSAALAALLLAALLPPDPAAPPRPGWSRQAVRTALAALTGAALLFDARHGGLGWPTAVAGPAGPGDWGPAEAALLAVAGAAFAVAAVGAVGPPRSWWRLVPVLSGLAVGSAGVYLAGPWASGAGADPVYLTAAVTPLLGATVLLGAAAGALAVARRRAAGAAVAVLAWLLLVPLSGVLGDWRIRAPAQETTLYEQWTLYATDVTSSDLQDPTGPYAAFRAPARDPAPVEEDPAVPGDVWSAEPEWRAPAWLAAAVLLAVGIAVGGTSILDIEQDPYHR